MVEPLVLRPFQERLVEHALLNPYCAIWADMGSGKTAIALTVISRLIGALDVARVLVVAPKRVASNVWPAEIARWAPFQALSCRVLTAEDLEQKRQAVTVRRRGRQMTVNRVLPTVDRLKLLTGEAIHTVSRDLFATLVRYLGKRHWPYDMVVLDEAQGFRNASSVRYRAAKALRKYGVLGRLIELSGTPRPKHLLDLWSQIYLLDQGERLGRTQAAYKAAHFTPGRRLANGEVVDWRLIPGAEDDIFRKLKDLCVSLLPEDAIQLPERTINPVRVALSPAARAQYDRLEREFLLPLAGADVAAVNRAVLVGKLLQIAGGAVYDEQGGVQHLHTEKLDVLEELVEDNPGVSLLVGYWYAHERDRIKARFPGAVELNDYPDTEDRWNRGEIDMLLLHPAKGAHGLNLQGNGGHGVWFGPIYDLELYQQWNKRLHRPGRLAPVVLHVLVARDTMDEAVLASLDAKAAGQDRLLEAVRLRLEGLRG